MYEQSQINSVNPGQVHQNVQIVTESVSKRHEIFINNLNKTNLVEAKHNSVIIVWLAGQVLNKHSLVEAIVLGFLKDTIISNFSIISLILIRVSNYNLGNDHWTITLELHSTNPSLLC